MTPATERPQVETANSAGQLIQEFSYLVIKTIPAKTSCNSFASRNHGSPESLTIGIIFHRDGGIDRGRAVEEVTAIVHR